MYQDTPILATSLKGRLALVYPDTLMLAPYSSHSSINTLPPSPPSFWKNFVEINVEFYVEKIGANREKMWKKKKIERSKKKKKSENPLEKKKIFSLSRKPYTKSFIPSSLL